MRPWVSSKTCGEAFFEQPSVRWSPSAAIGVSRGHAHHTARRKSSRAGEVARGQLAVAQLVGLWEANASLQHLKRVVTVDQVQRLHVQSEGLQEKVNLLYNALASAAD